MNIKTFAIAAGLVTVVSSQAVAQGRTDSPNTGSGSALTSTIVFLPSLAIVPGPIGGGGGYVVVGPAGAVTVSAEVGSALNALTSGAPLSGGQQTALVQAFGGTPQATSLVQALQTLASDRTGANLNVAIRAYNAAVNAGSDTPPPGLVAVRGFLANASQM